LVRRADKIREREAGRLEAYAASPASSACVVLVFDEGKGAVLTALKRPAPAIDFPAPRDYQLARWLEGQARRMKVAMDPDAARALADLSGEDYLGAMSELQRAALHADQGKKGSTRRITREAIEQLATRGRDTSPFHLADAVMGAEPQRAVKILRDLYDAGANGYMILGMLESQLRRFLAMRARVSEGQSPSAVIQSSSPTLPPAVKTRLTRQLERFDERRLIEALQHALHTDRAIKSYGSGTEMAHMESLIWRIAQ